MIVHVVWILTKYCKYINGGVIFLAVRLFEKDRDSIVIQYT